MATELQVLRKGVEALHERVVSMEACFEGLPISLRTVFERLVDVEKSVYRQTALSQWMEGGDSKRLGEPVVGWALGMRRLVENGVCPWCGQAVADIAVGVGQGVTWNCDKGCNP